MTNQLEALITKIRKQTKNFDTVILKEDEALSLIAALEQKDISIEELVNDRLQLNSSLTFTAIRAEKAEKRIAELESSHEKLRECLAGIHNTIKRDGAYTSLAAILSATNRAYEESATIKPVEASQLAVKLPQRIADIHLRSPLEVEDMWIARFTQASSVADKLQDSAFRHGLQHGFSYGQTNDQTGFERAMKAYSNISTGGTVQGDE